MEFDSHPNCSYFEDIPAAAAESFEFSRRFCHCGDQFHAVWTYVRLARGSSAVEADDSALQSKLSEVLAGGGKRIAIAGAGDAGLLASVARAASGHNTEILVIDRCATPLALCRNFAGRWALSVETVQRDLQISMSKRTSMSYWRIPFCRLSNQIAGSTYCGASTALCVAMVNW